ncbi:hypothetical protein OQX61_12390 [Pedobacter sp. PLR]|uniref:hypothetical protein n=1 Tax=Pedobacter sp. PLR TaxID=2994465 RepID=UPI0022457E49|nr:hypothetical protein [Pedobacter sp. PLR]MCX2452062.1 hypothetical protein [Pedobacter sp. PLR]
MRHLIFMLFGYLIFNTQVSKAQDNERSNIYYFLDTAAVPIKDRIFDLYSYGYTKNFNILCRCYPWNTNVNFFSINPKDTRPFTLQEFNEIKTVSLPDLIDIAIQYAKDRIYKYNFYFIEPVSDKMKITKVILAWPTKPRTHSTIIEIKPIKN